MSRTLMCRLVTQAAARRHSAGFRGEVVGRSVFRGRRNRRGRPRTCTLCVADLLRGGPQPASRCCRAVEEGTRSPFTAWMVVRRSKYAASPAGVAIGNAHAPRACTRDRPPIGRPSTTLATPPSVSAPGCFRRPALRPSLVPRASVSTTRLRVKKGPCAPLRFSSMPSRPRPGGRGISLMLGERELMSVVQQPGFHRILRRGPAFKPRRAADGFNGERTHAATVLTSPCAR